jgi:hypothetical protein
MSVVPIAAYLAEFGCNRSEPAAAASEPRSPGRTSPEELAAKLDEAHQRGFESGQRAALAVLEEKLQEERAAFARQLAAERRNWEVREADVLAERLAEGLRELQTKIAETTARVLAPVLKADVRRQAMEELMAELETLLNKTAGVAVTIAGPEDLASPLRERFSARGCDITYLPNNEPDVCITVDQTVLETRLGSWARKIEEALR